MNENERGSRTARSRSRRVCLRSADPPRARWLPGSLRVKPEAASPLLTSGESGGSRPGPTRRPHRGAHTCGWGGLSASGLRRCSPRGASPPGNRPVSQTSEAARLPGVRPRAARPGVGFPETPAGSGPREPPSRGPPAEKGRGLGSQLRPPRPPSTCPRPRWDEGTRSHPHPCTVFVLRPSRQRAEKGRGVLLLSPPEPCSGLQRHHAHPGPGSLGRSDRSISSLLLPGLCFRTSLFMF